MQTTIRYLFLSFLIGNLTGIGSHALAQKATPVSEQEKTAIGTGASGATAPTSTTDKKLPATKVVKKKPTSTTATSATTKPSTSIKKTTALPATPAYTPPAVKGVTKQPPAATATSVSTKPSTGIKKTTTLPVTPSYTPPAASFPQVSGKPPVQQSGAISITPRSGYVAPSFTPPPATGGTGVSGQGPGVKSTGTYVAPAYTPPSLSLPSKTVGVGTAVQGQGQGIRTPSGAYVIPDYDPPRSGPLGSGAPIGQPGSVTTAPRSGSVPMFPVSSGTGTGGQEQGVKTPSGTFLTPSSVGGKGVASGSEAAPAISSSTPPPAIDSSERLQRLKEKYGKGGTVSGSAMSDDESSKTAGGKSGEGGVAASEQTTGAGGTAPGVKAGKTAAAAAIESSAAASAASGIAGAEPKKASEGKGQSPETTGAGQQGETAADREKDLRERFNIPEDVPIKSTAEALGFAKQIELLGGKLTPETWRTWNEKGNEAVIKGTLCENYEIPNCAAVGSSKDIWDVLQNAATVGDGRVTPEQWRDVGRRGKDAVIDGMIEDTFGVSRPGNMSREDLLKGLAEGDRLGVTRQDRPSFIQDWDRQRNGGITLDELLNKWMPGARAGIDRGGLPGGGLPGGPGGGGSGLPGSPTGSGGPGGGGGRPGSLVDVINAGFGVGAAAGGLGGGVPGSGSSGTGMPGAPGGGSSGTGPGGTQGVGGGRAAGLLDTLGTGTGMGAAGQSGGGQGQGAGSGTTAGGGTGGTGSGTGGYSSSGSGSGGVGSGSGGVGGAGSGNNTASGPSTGGYVTYTDDGGFNLTAADDKGTVTIHFEPNKDVDGNNVGGYYAITESGDTLTMDSKPPEGATNSASDSSTTYLVTDQSGSSGSTTSSGSTGSGTDSSGSTASTEGTQGTEEGQSGMYNPDDDSLYRRGMSTEERAKAMEESQSLRPVNPPRGGEGGVRVTGRKMSDVDPAQSMRDRITPYTDPNPEADQSQHSGPIPVGDERGNIERPVPEGDNIAPGFGRMGDATRPTGDPSGPGGFDPRAAGQQQP